MSKEEGRYHAGKDRGKRLLRLFSAKRTLWLILIFLSARLRAMFRIIILFISIAWASLLLISWGGATPAPETPQQVVTSTDRS